MKSRLYDLKCDKDDLIHRLSRIDDSGCDIQGKVMGIRHGGFNANSGSIGSFVFAIPSILPVLAVGAGIGATLLSSALMNYFIKLDK